MIDLGVVRPVEEMDGGDAGETAVLREMFEAARAYLGSQRWCRRIERAFFGGGVGKVVAVFLFEIDAPPEVDRWLWVIEGDLPSAYLVTDDAPTPADAEHAGMLASRIESLRESVIPECWPGQ